MFKFFGKQGCGRSWLICTLLQFFPRNCFHAATTCRSLEMRRLRKSNLGAFSLFESCTEWRPACKTNFLPTAFDPRFGKPTQLGGGGKCKVGSRLEAGWAEAEGSSRQPEGEREAKLPCSKLFFCREKLCRIIFFISNTSF